MFYFCSNVGSSDLSSTPKRGKSLLRRSTRTSAGLLSSVSISDDEGSKFFIVLISKFNQYIIHLDSIPSFESSVFNEKEATASLIQNTSAETNDEQGDYLFFKITVYRILQCACRRS